MRPPRSPSEHAYCAAKAKAHYAFDTLWLDERVTRAKAYRLLALELGLSKDACHFRFFGRRMCERALDAVAMIGARLDMHPEPCYVWADHPHMRPMTEAELVNYWTTMPRPVAGRADAERQVQRFVRSGQLIQSHHFLR